MGMLLLPLLLLMHTGPQDSSGVLRPEKHDHNLKILAKAGDIKAARYVVNTADSVFAVYILCDSIRVKSASLTLLSRRGCALTWVAQANEVLGQDYWGNSVRYRAKANGAFFRLTPRWAKLLESGLVMRAVIWTDNDELAATVFYLEKEYQ